MKRWTLTFAVVGALAVAACGGKGGDAGGAGGAAPAGEGAGAAPAGAGAGFDKATTKKIVDAVSFEGWERGLANSDDMGFTLSFKGPKNDRDANINLLIGGMNCMASMCAELKADVWKKNEPSLKGKLSQAVAESPDLVFAIDEVDLDGKKAVGVYMLGYVETKDSEGGTSRASAHMYDLYWHDGQKLVTVSASASAWPQSRAELETKVTKDELKSAAEFTMKAIFAKM